jgi:hypothetical protein
MPTGWLTQARWTGLGRQPTGRRGTLAGRSGHRAIHRNCRLLPPWAAGWWWPPPTRASCRGTAPGTCWPTCPVPPAAGPRRPSLPRWCACTGCATGSSRATSRSRRAGLGRPPGPLGPGDPTTWARVCYAFRSSGRNCSPSSLPKPPRPTPRPPPRLPVRSYSTTATSLPLACPSPRYRSASGTSCNR